MDNRRQERVLLRNADWVVAWDEAAGRHCYRRGVDLLVAEGRIAALRPHDAAAPADPEAEIIEARGFLVMPGLVNAHTHPTHEPSYRGVREDHGVPAHYNTGLFERLVAFRLDLAGRQAAQKLAYAELLACGVTSVVDLSAPFEGWIDGMRAAGLRVWAGPVFASARWALEEPERLRWDWDPAGGRAAFQRALALLREVEAQGGGLLSGVIFPAQIDTVEEDLLREAMAVATETGRPFTTHIAQAVLEVQEMLRRHGTTPIQWAAQLGLLAPNSILGHAIFLDDHPQIGWHTRRDLDLLAEHGATVAHCPTPFARYGAQLRDFGRYSARGVRMAMGTDCAPHNLIEEMRLAILLARTGSGRLDAANVASVFHAATVGGADGLGRADLGRLAPGMAADLVMVSLDHPQMVPARDPLRALVFHAADRAVRHVFVAGQQVLRDGRPLGIDLTGVAGIIADSQAKMLRDAPQTDYRGRTGDVIAPLSLALR
jgi:cytosine/adenosine deaminase-related metal-dependent hydrolase